MKPSPTLRPSVGGMSGRPSAQYVGAHPCGEKIAKKRVFGAIAALARGVIAGTMESSSGNANVVPTPRRNVRRGIAFLVSNTLVGPPLSCELFNRNHLPFATSALHRRRRPPVLPKSGGLGHTHVHLERRALYDAHNQ